MTNPVRDVMFIEKIVSIYMNSRGVTYGSVITYFVWVLIVVKSLKSILNQSIIGS